MNSTGKKQSTNVRKIYDSVDSAIPEPLSKETLTSGRGEQLDGKDQAHASRGGSCFQTFVRKGCRDLSMRQKPFVGFCPCLVWQSSLTCSWLEPRRIRQEDGARLRVGETLFRREKVSGLRSPKDSFANQWWQLHLLIVLQQ